MIVGMDPEIMVPPCGLELCNERAVAMRQFKKQDPKNDPWGGVCGIHVFQPHPGAEGNPDLEWRITMLAR